MRKFSQLEKEVIIKIVELSDKRDLNVLSNILDPMTSGPKLPDHLYIEVESEGEVRLKVKDAYIKSDSENQRLFREIDNKISNMMLTVVSLFSYLEEQNLVYLVDYKPNSRNLGQKWDNENYTDCAFLDEVIFPEVYRYSGCKIFVLESLRELIANEFMSSEDIKHHANLKVAQLSATWARRAVLFTAAIFAFNAVMILIDRNEPLSISFHEKIANKPVILEPAPVIEKMYESSLSPIKEKLSHMGDSLQMLEKTFKGDVSNRKEREELKKRIDVIENEIKKDVGTTPEPLHKE